MSHRMPSGFVTFTNAAHTDRAVDLSNENPNGKIIGFAPNGESNQKWIVEPQSEKISYIQSGIGEETYVHARDGVKSGHSLFGSPEHTPFTFEHIPGNEVRIKTGLDLYWTLENNKEGTAVTLQRNNDSNNQVWRYKEVN